MLKIFKNWYKSHFSEPGTVEFAFVLLSIFIVIYYLMWLVGPVVIALCFAYILDSIVCFLARRFKLSRLVSSVIVMFFFISICIFFLLIIVPQLITQGSQFYNFILDLSSDVSKSYSNVNTNTDNFTNIDVLILNKINQLSKNLPDDILVLFNNESVLEFIHQARTNTTYSFLNFIKSQFVPSVFNIFAYMMYLIIVPIFIFLMLINKDTLKLRFNTYLLPKNKQIIYKFWPIINNQISEYIRGKIIHILLIAIVNTIAFKLFDLNYSILLGVGVGLSVIIPYVGAILIGVPVLFVSILQFGLSDTFFSLAIVYVLIQLLDSNVLTPMLFSKAMNLDAFSILLSILIFGGLWGFWGVFFAIPLATFVKTIVVEWPVVEIKD